jgi:hypothetical protein
VIGTQVIDRPSEFTHKPFAGGGSGVYVVPQEHYVTTRVFCVTKTDTRGRAALASVVMPRIPPLTRGLAVDA